MNYHEAMCATVSAAEARSEIELHADPAMRFDGFDPWTEFVAEFGRHVEYEGADVIEFLGY